MGSFSVAVRNSWLDASCRGIAYANTQIWAQLHIGDPGSGGTSNPAVNTTRAIVVFGAAAAAGSVSNTASTTWASAPATETYTHVSLWSAAVSGLLIGTDQLAVPAPASSGDPFSLEPGDLTLAVA